MRIYVASSWRNERQPAVVGYLREIGHDVYDFRNPSAESHGFAWDEIDPAWQTWTNEKYVEILNHPILKRGFKFDMDALQAADVTVLVMPSGRSAHLEAGYAKGAGQSLAILLPHPGSHAEPELMYKMADWIGYDLFALQQFLATQKDRHLCLRCRRVRVLHEPGGWCEECTQALGTCTCPKCRR